MNKYLKELKRYHRLFKPSPLERQFIDLIGPWYLLLHGFKREVKAHGYMIDLANPKRKLGIEIDGAAYHKDYVADWTRDQHLAAKGWSIYRVTSKDMRNPYKVYRDVKNFIKG